MIEDAIGELQWVKGDILELDEDVATASSLHGRELASLPSSLTLALAGGTRGAARAAAEICELLRECAAGGRTGIRARRSCGR